MTKNNKKIVAKIFSIIAVCFMCFTLSLNLTFAQSAEVKPATGASSGVSKPTGGIGSTVRQIGQQTKLPNFDAGHSDQSYESGASQLTSTVYFVLDFFKYVGGSLAVIMIIISGLKLIFSARTVADVMNKEKETLRFSFIGLVIILVAAQIVPLIFGQEGETFRSSADLTMAAQKATTFTQGLTGIIRTFIPSLAILYAVIAAFKLLISQGEPEKVKKAKTQMTWAVIGLVIAGLMEVVVFQILFPNNGNQLPDTMAFAKTVVTMTNFITGFVSTIAISMIMYAGYLYVMSMGGEGVGKAKKILYGAIIGLVISMAAFGLVNTFVHIPNHPLEDTPVQTK